MWLLRLGVRVAGAVKVGGGGGLGAPRNRAWVLELRGAPSHLCLQPLTARYRRRIVRTALLESPRTRRAPPSPQALRSALDRELLELPSPARTLAALRAGLTRRGLFFGDELIPTFLKPHLVDAARFDGWIADAELLLGLLEVLARRALEDPGVTRWLGFDEAARALFEIDPGYRRHVVLSRPDAVYDEGGRLSFVEVNTDSPAMMTFADEVEEELLQHAPLSSLTGRLSRVCRVQKLHGALLECYREWGGRDSPTVAIVDWPGERTAGELRLTARRFEALGTRAFVAHPGELSFKGGKLWARGERIQLVYRRVLFNDFISRAEELAPLLTAYRRGAICMANPLRSAMVGSKALLALFHDDSNPAQLSLAQRALARRLIPRTVSATPSARLRRENWVLKKAESHGGAHVVIGQEVGEEAWQRALAASGRERWVRQAFMGIPTLRLPVLRGKRFALETRLLNWSPFLFGGRHGGSIARVSASPLINICRGGGLLPSVRLSPSGE